MPTLVHRSIRHCLAMIAPFRPSLLSDSAGQRQLYDWFRALYQGMLENPEDYLVFPGPYEAYLAKNKQRLDAMRNEKNHFSDARESTLRNTFQQAIQFYALFLYKAGCAALQEECTPFQLSLLPDSYRQILRKMEKLHGAQHHPARYEKLKNLGLQIEERDNRVYILLADHPQAMEGLSVLCQAAESKYKKMNYLRLDFSNAGGIPSTQDALDSLPPEYRHAIHFMQEKAAALNLITKEKIRPMRGITSDFEWKIEYACKGKNIWGFYGDDQSLKICLYFNSPDKISRTADMLEKECPHLLSWYQDQFALRECKCRYNRAVHLCNIKKRICGLSNRMEILNPGEQDLENAGQILSLLHSPGFSNNF